MTRKLLSRLLSVFAILLVVCALAACLVSVLLKDLDHYTRVALQRLEDETGYRVAFTDIALHFERGVGLRLDNLTLSHAGTGREFLRGGHIYVLIKLSHLLQKKITVKQLLIEEPQVHVYRDAEGTWHSFLSDLLAQDAAASDSVFGGFYVSVLNCSLLSGTLEVIDVLHDSALRLHDCDISLRRGDGETFLMQLTAQHLANGSSGTISYTSEFHRSLFKRHGPAQDIQTLLTAALEFNNLPVRQCLSYLPERFGVPLDGGLLDGTLTFELKQDQQVLAGGGLVLRDAQVSVPGAAPVSLPEARFAFKAAIDPRSLQGSEFSLHLVPDISLSGSAAIENLDTDRPELAVHIASGTLNVREIAARVAAAEPKRLARLARACERISGGSVTINELELFAPLGAAFKADALRLRARLGVDELGYKLDPPLRLPALTGGTLSFELERGRLRGQGRAGLLPGDSHTFDFDLAMPRGKTRMNCTLTSRLIPESLSALLDGLGASVRGRAVLQEGSVTLRTGIHFDGSLRIASDIDATDASYSLAGTIGKPRGVPNTLRLDYEHTLTNAAQVPFVFRLGDSLITSGRVLFADGFAVEGQFAAKDFNLNSLSFPFLPRRLWLGGSVSGCGDFIFPARETGLRPVTGTLKLDGIALSTQSGSQPLLQADAVFDFFSGVEPISVSGGRVIAGPTRGGFSGTLDSVLPLVGKLSAPMDVYDVGDFINIMLDIVRSFEKPHDAPAVQPDDSAGMFARMDLKVGLSSRETHYLDWHFGPGTSDFSIKNKRLLWDAIVVAGGDGTLNGSVLYDLTNPDHFRLEFVIERSDVDVTWAIPGLQKKQTITGRLNLASRFSTNFKTAKEALENMEGTFDFVVKKGKIKGMTLLSNILNMLNVAKLLTLSMPEFSANGMPFDIMSGRFLLKHKVLTTDDFLLQCPSMDFSAAGFFDLGRGELDLLIGVQVFRTFAKVLGSVPYFGRKLTGKGKTLTFTYFRARGPFESPGIRPVPLKAIDDAILKIFKSVSEVPMDVIDLPLGVIRRFMPGEKEKDSGD